jgi:KDO2-lipid IV(A) lauroyltransferase
MAFVRLRSFLSPRYWYAWPALAGMLLISLLPGRILWMLGSGLGTLFSWFPSPSRRFSERNIELCFPNLNAAEMARLVNRNFRLFGFAVMSLCVAWWAPLWRFKRFATLRDAHFLEEALANQQNVVLLAPHFLGLDMGGVRLSADRKFVSMYRESKNHLLEYLFQRRSRFGGIVIERMASLKPIIRLIREQRPFYYLPDQDMGEKASVFVPFFNIPAATITALSRIAQLTGAVVIPCVTHVRSDRSGWEVRLYPPLQDFPTADPLADAARMNRIIEDLVREMPEQYMWAYRRFKTRPDNGPSLYKAR